MNRYGYYAALALAAGLAACDRPIDEADAYGHFEATEITVAAQQAGPLLWLQAEEGDNLPGGQLVGLIDTMPFHLQIEEVQARMEALELKLQDPEPRIAVLEERRRNLEREHARTLALVSGNAATRRQLEELEGQIEVVQREITSLRAEARLANRSILSERRPLQARLDQLQDQLARCSIVNPINGTVMLSLARGGEMASPGRPLYILAQLDTLELRVYVSGSQLPSIHLGQSVYAAFDLDAERNQTLPGKVSWIASEAEFTPKTIQTKEERVNLVYAVKVRVPNDGRLKVGMPGEMLLSTPRPDASETGAE